MRPRSRYNEALAFIRGGLQDVSLSRAKLDWGVRVPWDDVAGLLRLVGRAPQLLHGAVATRREGEDLTDDLLAGEPTT